MHELLILVEQAAEVWQTLTKSQCCSGPSQKVFIQKKKKKKKSKLKVLSELDDQSSLQMFIRLFIPHK